MIIFRKMSYHDNDKVPSYMTRKGGRLLSTLLVPLLDLSSQFNLTVSPSREGAGIIIHDHLSLYTIMYYR